ncbi:MAG: hypothetical protein ACPIOQ_06490 [Promethearchaeia archaeon]
MYYYLVLTFSFDFAPRQMDEETRESFPSKADKEEEAAEKTRR